MSLSKTSRIYNSKKNVSYGLIVTALGTLISFANRTAFVKCLGADYLGLNGLFSEILTMLSLAELGVGMAINYSLYKPIHENDYAKINQLMTLFKKTYNFISLTIFGLGVMMLPFVHLIVNGTNFDISYIRIVFFLFVINTSSSYLFSYNTSYITANQKQYVVSLTNILFKFVFSAFAIALLIIFRNYIFYLALFIIQTLTTNIFIAYYVRKKYPFLNFKEKLPSSERRIIFSNIRNIFIKRVSGVITSSTTNMLISTLVSTIQVGYYSNYVIFFTVIRTLKKQFSNGIKASIGDLTVTEAPEKCIFILRRLTFMFFAFSLVTCSGLAALCSDFISIWLGMEYVMTEYIVFVAIYNLFLEICSEPLWQYLEVSGLFKQDRNIAIVGSAVNIVIAIILGIKIGIVGIFLGTMSTQLIQIFLKSRLLFNTRFSKSSKSYLFFCLKMGVSFLLVLIVIHWFNLAQTTEIWVLKFVLKGLLSLIVSLSILFVFFGNSSEMKYSIDFVKSSIK